MRTTIEISDAHRGRLLELAAERGMKGFSGLVAEAIERYLAAEDEAVRRARTEGALAALGSLSEEAADHMEATRLCLRESWR